jgi:hypothetical protein
MTGTSPHLSFGGEALWRGRRSVRKVHSSAPMGLHDCQTCQYLIENVTVASTRHRGVQSLLNAAMKNVREDTNIFSLLQLKDSSALECREAVDQYRIHLLVHQTKPVMAKLRSAAC